MFYDSLDSPPLGCSSGCASGYYKYDEALEAYQCVASCTTTFADSNKPTLERCIELSLAKPRFFVSKESPVDKYYDLVVCPPLYTDFSDKFSPETHEIYSYKYREQNGQCVKQCSSLKFSDDGSEKVCENECTSAWILENGHHKCQDSCNPNPSAIPLLL